jgi:predicted acylesterase/phospholipase RssA
MNSIRILSIDGGGIRGIIPLKVLEYIERQTGKQIHELFDVIGGTSTGGIIALGLNSKIPKKGTIYKAQELLNFYTTQEDVKRIFKRKGIWQPGNEKDIDEDSTLEETRKADEPLRRPGIAGPYYESCSIEKYLQDKFGSDTKMSELQPKPDVTVFSYDIQNDCPYDFNSKKAQKPEHDYCIWQAARATSAAPTFFPAAKFSEKSNSIFVDGGVHINNPALALLIQAKDLYPNEQNFLLISLGTGDLKVSRADLEEAGVAQWMAGNYWPFPPKTHHPPGALLEVMMNGVSYTIDKQLQQLVSDKSGLKLPGLKLYKRYQKELGENIAMDDTEPETIEKLVKLGEALVDENKGDLDKLCDALVGS